MKHFLKKHKWLFFILCGMLIAALLIPLMINGIVMGTTASDIREIMPEDGFEYAVVLGAKVHKGGELSHMLRDRMDTAIALYHSGAISKILVSGDGSGEWSEPLYMKAYAVEKGVREADLIMDADGFSTYETVYRAKTVYDLEKFVLVTQKYHLYRALYIAEDLELEVLGADASLHSYSGQWGREIREVLARVKDFLLCTF